MSKLSETDNIDALIANFRAEKSRLKADIGLQAQIMLSLSFKRSENEENGKKIYSHELYLFSRGKATYILENGEEIDFLSQSGIIVPEKQDLGNINFLDESTAQTRYARELVRRQDEKWGRVYATNKEVSAVLNTINKTISAFEDHIIDIKAICPEANTDHHEPVSVSVAGMGEYFNRFDHFPGTSMPENYHSVRKWDGQTTDIILIPCDANIIIPSTDQNQLC